MKQETIFLPRVSSPFVMVQVTEMGKLTEQNQKWSLIATRMEVSFPQQFPTELFKR